MTQEIIAYLAEDGQIFRCKDDAEFADYQGGVGTSVARFLDQRLAGPTVTQIDPVELITAWELWRIGGRAGWTAAGTPPAPVPVPVAELSAEEAEAAPVKVRAKPGPKPKPKVEKPLSVMAVALDAARVTRERQQAEGRPGAPATKAYRKHVGVVGLFNIHHANIEREFGAGLKLTMYDADCIHRLDGLRACHKVLVLTKFISHKHVEVLKSIGQEPMLVRGGISDLKEALTAIYVNS